MELLIRNQQNLIPVTPQLEKMLSDAVYEALLKQGDHTEYEVSLLLVDDGEIKSLNKTYRGMDKPTDVLSFAMEEEGAGEEESEFFVLEDDFLLGDIVISMETARRQAEDYGHSLEREMGFLTVHGMLHLLGFDHETEEEMKEMRAAEEEILSSLGLKREG